MVRTVVEPVQLRGQQPYELRRSDGHVPCRSGLRNGVPLCQNDAGAGEGFTNETATLTSLHVTQSIAWRPLFIVRLFSSAAFPAADTATADGGGFFNRGFPVAAQVGYVPMPYAYAEERMHQLAADGGPRTADGANCGSACWSQRAVKTGSVSVVTGIAPGAGLLHAEPKGVIG